MGADGGATTGTYCVCDVICRHHWIRDFEEMNRTASIERRRPWQYKKEKNRSTYTYLHMQKAKERRDARHVENRMENERGSRENKSTWQLRFFFIFPLRCSSQMCWARPTTCVHGKMCEIRLFFFLWMLFKFVFFPAGGCWSCFSWTVRLDIPHGSQITAGSTFSLFFRNQVITHTRKEIRNCRNIYRLDSLYDSILIIIFPTFCVLCGKIGQKVFAGSR